MQTFEFPCSFSQNVIAQTKFHELTKESHGHTTSWSRIISARPVRKEVGLTWNWVVQISGTIKTQNDMTFNFDDEIYIDFSTTTTIHWLWS